MAAITIAANANWSASGITAADDVTINAGVTLTLDGMGAVKSITINGILYASRTASTAVTLTGNININDTGIFDFGTDASPLLAGVSSKIDLVCATNGQAEILLTKDAEFYTKATDVRLQYTTLTADTLTGSNIIHVASVSGWQVGDRLMFEALADGQQASMFTTTITAIAGLQVTLAAAVTYDLDGTTLPFYIANMEQPIWIGSSGAANTRIYVNRTNSTKTNVTRAQTLCVEKAGYGGWRRDGGIVLNEEWNITANRGTHIIDVTFVDCFNGVRTQSSSYDFLRVSVVSTAVITANAVYANNWLWATINGLFSMNTFGALRGDVGIGDISNIISIHQSRWLDQLRPRKCAIRSGRVRKTLNWLSANTSGGHLDIYNVVFDGNPWLNLFGSYGDVQMHSCSIPDQSGSPFWVANTSEQSIIINNRSGDPKDQMVAVSGGRIYRDVTHVISASTPVASIRFEPKSQDLNIDGKGGTALIPLTYSTSLTVLAGQILTASVLVDIDAAYIHAINPSPMPGLTVVGESTHNVLMTTAVGVVDTLAITMPAAVADHTATITLTANGHLVGAPGQAWFDDLTINGALHDIGQDLFAGGTEISNVIDITDTAAHITAPNLIDGTRVQIWNVTDSVEIDNSIVAGGNGYAFTLNYSADKTLRVRACYQAGAIAKMPLVLSGLLTSAGATFLDSQVDDVEYNLYGVDGMTVDKIASPASGEIQADFANIQIDVGDPNGLFDSRKGVSWWRYITQTQQGIAVYDPSALVYKPDIRNILINGSLQLENVSASPVKITAGIWQRADGLDVIASTSGTVWWVPDARVYQGPQTGISGLTTAESNTLSSIPTNPLLTTDARLNNLDAAISTVGSSGITLPQIEASTVLAKEATVNTRLAAADYTSPDSSLTATQVSELHKLNGLDPTNPLTVDDGVNRRYVGNAVTPVIDQTVVTTGNKTVVSRQ